MNKAGILVVVGGIAVVAMLAQDFIPLPKVTAGQESIGTPRATRPLAFELPNSSTATPEPTITPSPTRDVLMEALQTEARLKVEMQQAQNTALAARYTADAKWTEVVATQVGQTAVAGFRATGTVEAQATQARLNERATDYWNTATVQAPITQRLQTQAEWEPWWQYFWAISAVLVASSLLVLLWKIAGAKYAQIIEQRRYFRAMNEAYKPEEEPEPEPAPTPAPEPQVIQVTKVSAGRLEQVMQYEVPVSIASKEQLTSLAIGYFVQRQSLAQRRWIESRDGTGPVFQREKFKALAGLLREAELAYKTNQTNSDREESLMLNEWGEQWLAKYLPAEYKEHASLFKK